MEKLTVMSKDTANTILHRATSKFDTNQHQPKRPARAMEAQKEQIPTPTELVCPICSELLRDAVSTTCCRSRFCVECVEKKVLEDPEQTCPGDGCTQVTKSILIRVATMAFH
jgi:hypothetical protein